MGIGKITKLSEKMNHERLRLIALGREKEKELGRNAGDIFSTVLFTKGLEKTRGGYTAGYFTGSDKAIRIYDRFLREGRAFIDEIMLHELAHGLDHVTEGYKERPNCHDDRFVTAARILGANVSRYLKCGKQKTEEELLEKDRWENYIPPEFPNLPDDRNNCSLILDTAKRISAISKSAFTMTVAYADVLGDWQKNGSGHKGVYVMRCWGSYESLESVKAIFPKIRNSICEILRKYKQSNTRGIAEGIKYGFLTVLKEQKFSGVSNLDFSCVDRMKDGRAQNKDFVFCDNPGWSISVNDFWNGFAEGQLLAEQIHRNKLQNMMNQNIKE